MEPRRLIAGAAASVLVLAIVLLYMRVSRSASPDVDPDQLAEAAKEYQSRSRAAPVPSTSRSLPTPTAVSTPVPPAPTPPSEPEVVEPKRSAITSMRAGALQLPKTHKKELGSSAADQPYEDRRLATNKLYDRHRYPQAREAALKLLEEQPDDRRMRRVVVSASCIMFEPDVAREHYQKLAERDKKTMKLRCARYGVEDLD